MDLNNNQLTRFLTRLSIIISVLVGTSVPISYGLIAYHDLGDSLSFKAQIKANSQTELITSMPDMWMYAENRIQGLLKRAPIVFDNEQVQLFDSEGSLITSAGKAINPPLIQRSYPLYDIGTIVGEVVVSASLVNFIINTIKAAVLGFVLAFLLFFTMRLIPIRHLKKISDELYEEKERAFVTLDSINDAVLRTDVEARLRFINTAGEKMLGQSLQKLKGRPISDILHISEHHSGEPIVNALVKALSSRMEVSCNRQSMLCVGDNIKIAIEERAAPIFNNKGELSGAVLCLRDVTVARNDLDRRTWEASHDPLTRIWNRRAFESSIDIAIKHARHNTQHYVLCFMDLDRFKVINDSCGHAAGDQLLIQVTQLIQSKIRKNDVLARLGGDEFGLLLEGCNPEQGKVIGNELIKTLEGFQFSYDHQVYTVGISIGLTTITSNSSLDLKSLIGDADSACYWAKEHGRNQVCHFLANDMHLAAKRSQTSWVGRITSALKDNRFVLYHQKYRLLNHALGMRLHLEVLLRMVDENGAIIAPDHFLPAAERYDIIQEIDRWVINKVFSSFHLLLSMNKGQSLMVNINLSGASINSGYLLKYIQEKAAEFNIDTESICFEVTETVAVKNLHKATDFINECKKMGIKFALDDFGTGSSSFAYLKNLPVDYLKIDGSFIKNLETSEVDKEMVSSINRIGHIMGKVTVAEFAENEAIIDILAEMGVDFAQGYGVCLPLPLFPNDE